MTFDATKFRKGVRIPPALNARVSQAMAKFDAATPAGKPEAERELMVTRDELQSYLDNRTTQAALVVALAPSHGKSVGQFYGRQT